MERTRIAILDAAVQALIYKSSASYTEIAELAGTARSTVHRYFPERRHLIDGLQAYAGERIMQAKDQARLQEDAAHEAAMRLAEVYFEIGDLVVVAYAERYGGEEPGEPDEDLMRLLRRGQEEGTIDPTLSALWFEQLLWTMIFSAWSHIRSNQVSKLEALGLCKRAIEKVMAP